MSKTNQEELLAVLWIIAALLAFDSGWRFWGYLFAVSSGLCVASSFLEAKITRLHRKSQSEE